MFEYAIQRDTYMDNVNKGLSYLEHAQKGDPLAPSHAELRRSGCHVSVFKRVSRRRNLLDEERGGESRLEIGQRTLAACLDDGGGSIGTSNRIPVRSFIQDHGHQWRHGFLESVSNSNFGSRPKYIRDRHSRSSTTTGTRHLDDPIHREFASWRTSTAKIIRRTIGSLEHSLHDERSNVDEFPWTWFANPGREEERGGEREREDRRVERPARN